MSEKPCMAVKLAAPVGCVRCGNCPPDPEPDLPTPSELEPTEPETNEEES